MIFQILLLDTVTNEVEKVEDFTPESDGEKAIEELKERLLELQAGYCEDETPTVSEREVLSNRGKLIAMFAQSDVDFAYISVIKKLY